MADLDGADVSLDEAKQDADLLAERPAFLKRDEKDMLRYLAWEKTLGEKYII